MKLLYTLVFLLAFAAVGHAKPITFIFEADVSGYSTVFGGEFSAFKVTAYGDTADRQDIITGNHVYSYVRHVDAAVELPGLGKRNFSELMHPLLQQIETWHSHTEGSEYYMLGFYHGYFYFNFIDPL